MYSVSLYNILIICQVLRIQWWGSLFFFFLSMWASNPESIKIPYKEVWCYYCNVFYKKELYVGPEQFMMEWLDLVREGHKSLLEGKNVEVSRKTKCRKEEKCRQKEQNMWKKWKGCPNAEVEMQSPAWFLPRNSHNPTRLPVSDAGRDFLQQRQ